MLWHCWLDSHVAWTISQQQSPKDLLWDIYGEPSLTWTNLQKHRPVEQQLKVASCTTHTTYVLKLCNMYFQNLNFKFCPVILLFLTTSNYLTARKEMLPLDRRCCSNLQSSKAIPEAILSLLFQQQFETEHLWCVLVQSKCPVFPKCHSNKIQRKLQR